MIKVFIVDDEIKAVKSLKALLEKYCQGVIVAGYAQSVAEAEEKLLYTPVDAVFLDIEMPGENGFMLLDRIKNLDFEVVFTTAYDRHAIKAIKYAALDYLLKPVDLGELKTTVNKLKQRQTVKLDKRRIEMLLQNLSAYHNEFERIAVVSMQGLKLMNVPEITYLQADGSYTEIHTLYSENVIISSKNLKYYEELLPKHIFIKTHRKNLVNKNFIKEYKKESPDKVVLLDDTELEVSFRKREEVIKMLSV